MKNLITYYLTILIPLLLLVLLSKTAMINSTWFFICLMFYVFVYRTYTDGKRLIAKGVIYGKDVWRILIPGLRLKYFRELYLS